MAPLTLSLTNTAALGLYFIHRYRFLTIEQYARAAGVKRDAASDRLRQMERHGFLGHFGNVGVRGYGKVPKAYFLNRRRIVRSSSGAVRKPRLVSAPQGGLPAGCHLVTGRS